jgi:uncharacterized protein
VPTAPVEDQLRLLQVQELDTRAQQLAHQRANHPLHADLADLEHRLADVDGALVASRTALGDLRRELAKAEQDVEQVRTRAARDRARLESGGVGAKDAQALMSELESLGRRQDVREEAELEVMERLEAHEKAVADLTAAQEDLHAQRSRLSAELGTATSGIDAEAAQVAAERARRADGIDEGLVRLYDRLREQLGGLAVAALRGRRCEGCRLELNAGDVARITAAPPEQVVRCEECGRILVRGADAAR